MAQHDGGRPAFPAIVKEVMEHRADRGLVDVMRDVYYPGLTKREYIAVQAMVVFSSESALSAIEEVREETGGSVKATRAIAIACRELADALLAELAKGEAE